MSAPPLPPNSELIELVKSHVGTFNDFPKKGIVFFDLFTAMRSGPVCAALKKLLVDHVRANHPDVEVIVGLEARGFLFSLLLAAELGIGSVPIRKRGKLPGNCAQHEYKLEYGSDVFEIQKDSIRPGQKVLVVDDLLATGGTLDAAVRLVGSVGGVVAECVVLMELLELNGRQKVGAPLHTFIQY